MNILETIKYRRTIRKFTDQQVSRADLEKVIEAGLFAPNAGGAQRPMIVGLRNKRLCDQIGRLNIARFDRSKLAGFYVSKEQPSIIDDPTAPSGFYGAPTVCVICCPEKFLYSIADAHCCAENMVLEATELGLASAIVARAEETFDHELGRKFLDDWGVPADYVARCFVLLGYCRGDYPAEKARKPGRSVIVDED
jgi:nitroreductase